jgi:hypothetical protein
MRKFFDDCRKVLLRLFAILMLAAPLFLPGSSQAEELCGLSLGLYIPQGEGPQYDLGSPVKVILVIKNVTGFTLKTERGFSQVDLYQSLILTDPSGKAYKLTQSTKALDMPPPFFLNGRVAIPAEALPADWARTVTVNDLTDLFPSMKTNPGWYSVEAQQPLLRFGATVQDSGLGLLGIEGEPDQCQGVLKSNRLSLYISPGSGAQLQVQVLDKSSVPAKGLSQVPVKVFQGNIPVSGLKDAWVNGLPVLTGTTNPVGLAVWGTGLPCKPKGSYTAVAYYQGAYTATTFEEGAPGWGPGCGSTMTREIFFSDLGSLPEFSVLGSNSVWLTVKTIVKSGNIGVVNASPGLWLDSGVEISVGVGARTEDGVKILGDSVRVARNASVYDVYYNELQNRGMIRGESVTPLSLPLPVSLPPLPEITPGRTLVSVKNNKGVILDPGMYGDVVIGNKATLRLRGGVYHFKSFNIGNKASLICLAPTEIRIKERMYPGNNAYIGPSQGSALTAKDVIFYIGGTNGHMLNLLSLPKAAEIGQGNVVKANMVVPNGTLWINTGSDITGSFIAQGVIVGVGTKVNLESAF